MCGNLALLDVVALLSDLPAHRLSRGQVGTVVEVLEKGGPLVEFSDENGRSFAIASLTDDQVLRLQYQHEAA